MRDHSFALTSRTPRSTCCLLALASVLAGAQAYAATGDAPVTREASVRVPPEGASPQVVPPASNPPIVAPGPETQTKPPESESPAGFAKQFPKNGLEMDRGADDGRMKHSLAHPKSLAAMLDAGLPDGAVVGLAYRPTFWTRLQAGAGYNSISPGVRVGAVLIPFSEGPSLTVEGGYYFEGDANSIIGNFAGSAYSKTRTLQKVGYQFVNFHVGLDFGSTFATVFIHGGMTYLHTTLHDANDVFGGQTVNSQGEVTTYTFNQDISLKLWFPSGKLGLLIYFV